MELLRAQRSPANRLVLSMGHAHVAQKAKRNALVNLSCWLLRKVFVAHPTKTRLNVAFVMSDVPLNLVNFFYLHCVASCRSEREPGLNTRAELHAAGMPTL